MNRFKAAAKAFKEPRIVETYPALADHYLNEGTVTIPVIKMDDDSPENRALIRQMFSGGLTVHDWLVKGIKPDDPHKDAKE